MPVDDQIDLFCVVEALLLHYEKYDAIPAEANIIKAFNSLFWEKLEDVEFIKLLTDRKLILSVHRVNLGRKLCLFL